MYLILCYLSRYQMTADMLCCPSLKAVSLSTASGIVTFSSYPTASQVCFLLAKRCTTSQLTKKLNEHWSILMFKIEIRLDLSFGCVYVQKYWKISFKWRKCAKLKFILLAWFLLISKYFSLLKNNNHSLSTCLMPVTFRRMSRGCSLFCQRSNPLKIIVIW